MSGDSSEEAGQAHLGKGDPKGQPPRSSPGLPAQTPSIWTHVLQREHSSQRHSVSLYRWTNKLNPPKPDRSVSSWTCICSCLRFWFWETFPRTFTSSLNVLKRWSGLLTHAVCADLPTGAPLVFTPPGSRAISGRLWSGASLESSCRGWPSPTWRPTWTASSR